MNTLHLIGNTHFDPVWLWTWDEALASVRATFRSALDRMDECSDFIYSFSTPAVFRWIEKTDPDLFGEIRRRVREGRWEVESEGWYLQPDCNAPCGESLVRQGLYGQQYLIRAFGKKAEAVFNIDSFGHSAMMPQILKKSGIRYYLFSRPGPWELSLSDELFFWEAPDGSRVTAFRASGDNYAQNTAQAVRNAREKLVSAPHDFLLVYGVTDHGGAPTKKSLGEILAAQVEPGSAAVRFGTVCGFFRAGEGKPLPMFSGELQTRYYGPFSDGSGVKSDSRRCENSLLSAEKASFLANRLCGKEYPAEALRSCWQDELFSQFHDILGGTCIKEAYPQVRDLHGRALQTSAEIRQFALQSVCAKIRMPGVQENDAWNLCVFNLGGSSFRGILEAEVQWAWEFPWYSGGIELVKEDGSAAEAQIVAERSAIPGFRSRFAFEAEVPALGYRIYAVRKTGKDVSRDYGEKDVPSPFALQVYEDDGDTWCFNTPEGFGKACEVPTLLRKRTVESGNLFTSVKRTWKFRESVLEETVTVYRGHPWVDCSYRVNWNEEHTVLKLLVPQAERPEQIIAAVPYGTAARQADGREYPVGEWLAWKGGTEGTLLLRDIFAYDTADGELRLTLLRSPIYGDLRMDKFDTEREYSCMEQGIRTCSVRWIPFGVSRSEAFAAAEQFCRPPEAVCEGNHGGTLPSVYSALSVSSSSPAVTAVKEAEDGNGFVLRLLEYDGAESDVTLRLADFPAVSVTLHPFEIKTLRFTLDGAARETDLLEENRNAENDAL